MKKLLQNFTKEPSSTIAGLVTGLAIPLVQLWATGSVTKETVIAAVVLFITGGSVGKKTK